MFQKLLLPLAFIVLISSCAKDDISELLDNELLIALEAAANGKVLNTSFA